MMKCVKPTGREECRGTAPSGLRSAAERTTEGETLNASR